MYFHVHRIKISFFTLSITVSFLRRKSWMEKSIEYPNRTTHSCSVNTNVWSMTLIMVDEIRRLRIHLENCSLFFIIFSVHHIMFGSFIASIQILHSVDWLQFLFPVNSCRFSTNNLGITSYKPAVGHVAGTAFNAL
ncbi:hypothetical protein CEXT_773261 [Caerostris extrusa]|uniref:Uncharacterized protein n=1 Tax=Caerostris extrusa TaxID=172846 RepID=A0AAV4WYE4_CAEEX|nr:hypothetical protein CEXT_773261 [Caerostris extrusa]